MSDTTDQDAELEEVLSGLREDPPTLSPRWFYDELGSALYEAITRLPEYYPARAEHDLLESHGPEIGGRLPERALLVELGSGSAAKASRILPHMRAAGGYHPLEVSVTALDATVEEARERFPALEVRGHAVSFADPDSFGELLHALGSEHELALYFSGSTISNFERHQANELLDQIAARVAPGTAFLLGLDLIKAPERLVAAYDDSVGVTAAFNRNALAHLNREFGTDFEPRRWAHEAVWNEELERIEMWLCAREREVVRVGETELVFEAGTRLHTESSHKWSTASVETLIEGTPWKLDGWWTDARSDFGEALLVRTGA